MNRIHLPGLGPAVDAALELYPPPARALLECDLWAGIDPVFAGLHRYDTLDDGRSYRTTAHVCYPRHVDGHADRRRTTIVLPTRAALEIPLLVHELGHVLDERLGFELTAAPVTAYARGSRMEAFAEAVRGWLTPEDPVFEPAGRDPAFEARLASILDL